MIYRKALTSELSNTAGGAFTVLFSIVVTIGLVRILNQTAGGRYDTGSILEVVAYTSLINLPALISLALFLAVFMTLNRYWRDSEMFVWFPRRFEFDILDPAGFALCTACHTRCRSLLGCCFSLV